MQKTGKHKHIYIAVSYFGYQRFDTWPNINVSLSVLIIRDATVLRIKYEKANIRYLDT